jgi:hypothetical protein
LLPIKYFLVIAILQEQRFDAADPILKAQQPRLVPSVVDIDWKPEMPHILKMIE